MNTECRSIWQFSADLNSTEKHLVLISFLHHNIQVFTCHDSAAAMTLVESFSKYTLEETKTKFQSKFQPHDWKIFREMDTYKLLSLISVYIITIW